MLMFVQLAILAWVSLLSILFCDGHDDRCEGKAEAKTAIRALYLFTNLFGLAAVSLGAFLVMGADFHSVRRCRLPLPFPLFVRGRAQALVVAMLVALVVVQYFWVEQKYQGLRAALESGIAAEVASRGVRYASSLIQAAVMSYEAVLHAAAVAALARHRHKRGHYEDDRLC